MGLSLFNTERAKHDPAQFCDLDYFEFIKDPIAVVEGIYRQFGIEFTDAARTAMERWHAESQKGPRAPKHTYSLEDYGLTAGSRSRSASRGSDQPREQTQNTLGCRRVGGILRLLAGCEVSRLCASSHCRARCPRGRAAVGERQARRGSRWTSASLMQPGRRPRWC